MVRSALSLTTYVLSIPGGLLMLFDIIDTQQLGQDSLMFLCDINLHDKHIKKILSKVPDSF